MPSDYEKITNDNIRWYGERDKQYKFFGDEMYSIRTHFILELIQNADDAKAKNFMFNLNDGALEVRHDGNSFTKKDVIGICGIFDSYKSSDSSTIGRFGIGFKSVYAYTTKPEIHSGDENFYISKYIRPFKVTPKPPGKDWTTLFYLPLGKEDISTESAFSEIEIGLQNLNPRILLFLRKIESIEVRIRGEKINLLKRKSMIYDSARRETISSTSEPSENWLIYKSSLSDSDNKYVEVAFNVSVGEKDEIEKVQKIENSKLVIFFPTEVETHIGFLMQGPYDPTTSRETIKKDSEWNKELIRKTSELLVLALIDLKKKGLLTVSVLETLPIRTEHFQPESIFFPLGVSIVVAINENELLPTSSGTYASNKNVKIGRSNELRKLFNPKQLGNLYQSQSDIYWLTEGVTEYLTPDLFRFLNKAMDIEIIRSEDIIGKLNEEFLVKQTDDWICKLYEFANEDKNKVKNSIKLQPIVRLQDGTHVHPFNNDKSPNAYLPSEEKIDTNLPLVKSEICENHEALLYLRSIGLPVVDLVESVIENVLPRYKEQQQISDDDHLNDLNLIKKALSVDSEEKRKRFIDILKETPLLKTECSNDKNSTFSKPTEIYFPEPELKMYFDQNNSIKYISSFYNRSSFDKIFYTIGVEKSVRVFVADELFGKKVCNIDYSNQYANTSKQFKYHFSVDGLEIAIKNINREKSEFIWNKIVLQNIDFIYSSVNTTKKNKFTGKEVKIIYSEFGRLLLNYNWLPNENNEFKKPSELKQGDLPKEFKNDLILAKLLGMLQDEVAEFLESKNLTIEDMDFWESHQEEFNNLKEKLMLKDQGVSFPEKSIENPERRAEKLSDHFDNSVKKKYRQKVRNVRVTKISDEIREWLKNNYTDESGFMFCQICKKEMPFKKPDGEYYFEAVEAFNREILRKEVEQQFLALCPVCAAKYKVFVKRDKKSDVMENLKKQILDWDPENELEFPVNLGEEKNSIKFVEKHIFDIKVILEKYEKELKDVPQDMYDL